MFKYKKHLLELLSIAMPMVIGNLGHVLTGATDVFVAAKHGVDTLAAIAIANSILFTIFILGIGALSGISIILANYRGERKPTKKYLFSGIIISQISAFFTWAAIVLIAYFIPLWGFEENLIPNIQGYMYITSFSIFGMFLFQAVKEFLQAHEIVNYPNMILLITVVINLILDFVFVFGIGPIPSLGVIGLAISTLFVRILLAVMLLFYVRKIIIKQYNKNYDFDYIKKVIKIGFPIGIGLLFEFLGFNIVTMSVGRDAGILAATHNILLTIIDATFMIPLSISSAISIKVGYYNGANDLKEIKNYGYVGIAASTIFMAFCSAMFLLKPELFIGFFTKDSQIISIALPIVTLFAIFEIADGLQVSMGGVLKGLEKTKQVTTFVLLSYWLIGIPLGFYLAYGQNLSLKGFWIGLITGLFFIALFENIFMQKTFHKIKNVNCCRNL